MTAVANAEQFETLSLSGAYKLVFIKFQYHTVEMAREENAPALFLSYKTLEILFIVSATINFCVTWSVILPKLCRAILRGVCQRRRKDELVEECESEIPFFCRRL